MSGQRYAPRSGYHDQDGGSLYDPPTSSLPPHRPSSRSARHSPANSIQQTPQTPRHGASFARNSHDSPVNAVGQSRPVSSIHPALRDVDNLYNPRMESPSPPPSYDDRRHRSHNPQAPPPPPPHMSLMPRNQPLRESQTSIAPLVSNRPHSSYPRSPSRSSQRHSPAPNAYLGAAGIAAGSSISSLDRSLPRSSYYHGDGYDEFDPRDIADDGDDGFNEPRPASAAPTIGLSGTGVMKAFGGSPRVASGNFPSRNYASGNYGPVASSRDQEKSDWLQQQSSGQKRLRWLVGVGIVVVVLLAVAGGVIGGVLGSRKSSSSSGDGNSNGVAVSQGSSNGLWDSKSREIKAVMGNKNLHKVFPTIDYTPLNAQYPACLTNPPDQNNVTLDIAILSQLTPAVRSYGTDCNQTAMVLEAMDRLNLGSTMKLWLGVYLDGNTTTNARQIAQMYDILDQYPASRFAGIIVGNEVLFGQYLTPAALAEQLQAVRTTLTAKGIALTVSTADLGRAWVDNPSLASSSDIIMANVHPFFAGVTASQGESWAWTYWQGVTGLFAAKTGTLGGTTYPKQIIGEIGWPSQGGHHCGGEEKDNYGCVTSDDGAVASVANMNTFMGDWICQALSNGTNYFWFEAFDEPWKHRFDTPLNKWEPYWGLMDVNRNLKKGLVIPDCGGATVDKPYF